MLVSIIIPVFRNNKGLDSCLKALEVQTWPRDQFEILVVNNDPEKDIDVKTDAANLHILREMTPGSYAARNKGINEARGEITGFCDSDCIPSRDWIEKAVRFFKENPDCMRLAGKIELFTKNPEKPATAELYEQVFAFRQEDYARKGAAATANMFAYRSVFADAGLFRQDLMSGGDLEWGHRAQKAGHAIGFSPEVVVQHPARKSVQELILKSTRVVSGYIVLHDARFRTNPGRAIVHGLIMLKPPLESARMIFARRDLPLMSRATVYGLEYLLKLVQLGEFIRLQAGGLPRR